MSFDLNKLENKLDESLSHETSESLTNWLEEKRMTNNKLSNSIEDFDLSEYEFFRIKRIYRDYWIILAQTEFDYQNKINKIDRGDSKRGDRKGFLTINTAKRK